MGTEMVRMRREPLHVLAQIGAIGKGAELGLHFTLRASGFGGKAG
jgi:hypothetical protein